MRVAKRYDEAVFEDEVFLVVNSDEGSGAIAQVSEIILFIHLTVLNNHVPFSDAASGSSSIHIITYYKVVIMLTCLQVLLLRSNNSATIFFLPLTCHQALGIYDKLTPNHLLSAFHDLYLKYRG